MEKDLDIEETQEEKTEGKANKKNKKTSQDAEKDIDVPIVYEVSYILLPALSDEEVKSHVVSIKSTIISLNASVIAEGDPVLIDLAYPMLKTVGTIRHKVQSGFFGWIKFDLPQGEILAVKKFLDAHDVIVRSLIIKTVRENTFIAGRMQSKKDEKNMKREDEPGDEIPVGDMEEAELASPEEIDKSIDDLVIA